MADTTTFGLSAALIKAYPELQEVYDLLYGPNKDEAEAKLKYYQTNYYKSISATSSDRTLQKESQPGIYANNLEKYKLAQRKRLTTAGVSNVDDATLEAAYLGGWDDNQLDIKALAGKGTKPLGGDALGTADALKTFANSFGMTYSPSQYDKWSIDIFSGNTTIDDLKNKVKTDAASAYPAYAEQILKGTSLDSLASAYRTSIANILEVDPDSVDYNNPFLRRALQNVGPDGKPIIKPIWQFEKELRSSKEWEYTNNARDTMDTLSLKVLRDWGLA
jgi:hypothetical protein